MIIVIIRVVRIDNVWFYGFKIIFLPIRNLYVIRIIIPFIMHLPKAVIGIHIVIRNRHAIYPAIRIGLCRKINALQAVPHRGFIRKKYNFFLYGNVIFDTVFYFYNLPAQDLICFVSIDGSAVYVFINPKQQFAVLFQFPYADMAFSL